MPTSKRPLIRGQRPVIGSGAGHNATSNFNTLNANEMAGKNVIMDLVYFAPAEGVDRPLKIADILDANKDVFENMWELLKAQERDNDFDDGTFAIEIRNVLGLLQTSQSNHFTGVQRFVLSGDDIAEGSDSDISNATERLNNVGAEFARCAGTASNPKYYNILLSRVVESVYGTEAKRPKDVIQLDFIAAHGMEYDPMRIVREVPFAGARLFLMNWMFENHGPLAMARIAHAPKFFNDGGNAGRSFGYRPSTLRH